ncbi:hypothetical protein CYY_004751 [Polysphondylium violaceum]|uniref:Uncharacterized protein n=1 Tax=Polysphondylium violaceum TaxID=133409 RepID=A0A8J4PUL4_9MYCE|nr:hypothetical protein CYY_004751 [Polysphondylium violaceum]
MKFKYSEYGLEKEEDPLLNKIINFFNIDKLLQKNQSLSKSVNSNAADTNDDFLTISGGSNESYYCNSGISSSCNDTFNLSSMNKKLDQQIHEQQVFITQQQLKFQQHQQLQQQYHHQQQLHQQQQYLQSPLYYNNDKVIFSQSPCIENYYNSCTEDNYDFQTNSPIIQQQNSSPSLNQSQTNDTEYKVNKIDLRKSNESNQNNNNNLTNSNNSNSKSSNIKNEEWEINLQYLYNFKWRTQMNNFFYKYRKQRKMIPNELFDFKSPNNNNKNYNKNNINNNNNKNNSIYSYRTFLINELNQKTTYIYEDWINIQSIDPISINFFQ